MKYLVILALGFLCYTTAGAYTQRRQAVAPVNPVSCPIITTDFAFLDGNTKPCHNQLIFDALFVHNSTGDFALVPRVYKVENFAMGHPLRVEIQSPCVGPVDEEVFCVFANKPDFSLTGDRIQMTDKVRLVKDSCNTIVAAKCKSAWDITRRQVARHV